MQEATIADRIARMRNEAALREAWEIVEDASLIERQQQVIDLLMKAVEPFAKSANDTDGLRDDWSVADVDPALTTGDLRRAREAKEQAERILSQPYKEKE